jgi:hypothetical protein
LLTASIDETIASSPEPRFEHVTGVPHQTNSFDCGVYVLAFTEALAGVFAQSSHCGSGSDLAAVTPDFVSAMRVKIRELAYRLGSSAKQ